ncbi:MAG TPA: TonB-dependent receptor [Ignavibacteriales bacterium]|nr:TonB-dependent receptor [Ignavibacteriales bacterium]
MDKKFYYIIFLIFVLTKSIFSVELFKLQNDTLNKIDFSLEDLLNLEVTTASKKVQIISEIPASFIIINRTDIKRAGYTSLEELLSQIPGLYYIDYKGYIGPSIGVRGYLTQLNTNIKVLLNGVPITNNHYNAFSFNALNIPVETIDRIEIVRGPMSIIYGSNSFFGVINIITNDIKYSPITNKSIKITAGYPKVNRLSVSIFDNFGDYKFSFSSGLNDVYGIDKPFNKMVTNFEQKAPEFGITNPDKKSKNYFDNRSFFSNLSLSNENFQIDLLINRSNFGQTFSTLFYHPAINRLTNINSSLTYKNTISENLSFMSKISYNSFFLYMADNYFSKDTNGFMYDNDIYSYGEYYSDDIAFSTDIFYSITPKLNLQTGIEYIYTKVAGDKTDAPFNPTSYNLINRAGGLDNSLYRRLALYSQLTYNITDNLSFVGGLRTERIFPFDIILHKGAYTQGHQKFTQHINDNKFYLLSRAAILYKLSNNNTLKLLYGEAIRFPSLWEYRNNIITKKHIKPEKITTKEINYISLINKKLSINISLFSNQFDNLITRTINLNPPYTSFYNNSNKINTYGSEFILIYDITNFLKTDIAITYQNSKYTNKEMENIELEYSPHWLSYIKVNVLPYKNLSFNLSINYVDKMEAQWDNNLKDPSNPNLGVIGRYGKSVPSYWIANVNFLASNLTYNDNLYFSINFSIHNIFDQEIRYAANSVSAWADKGILDKGREFILGVTFNF